MNLYAMIEQFDQEKFTQPDMLGEYYDKYAGSLLAQSFPDTWKYPIMREIKERFWRQLYPEQYKFWLRNEITFLALRTMEVDHCQEACYKFNLLSNVFNTACVITRSSDYVDALIQHLNQEFSPEDERRLLADVILDDAMDNTSNIYRKQVNRESNERFIFYLRLFSAIAPYYPIPENVFDFAAKNGIDCFVEQMPPNIELFTEAMYRFYIDHLERKLNVCTDEESEVYEVIYSKTIAIWNRNMKQNERMAKKECAKEVSERNNEMSLFQQSMKRLGGLFKGRR